MSKAEIAKSNIEITIEYMTEELNKEVEKANSFRIESNFDAEAMITYCNRIIKTREQIEALKNQLRILDFVLAE